jgi:hypothetical protein
MAKKQKFRVLAGMNYGPNEKRAEAGDVVDDLPAESIDWLKEQGYIEPDGEPSAAIATEEG